MRNFKNAILGAVSFFGPALPDRGARPTRPGRRDPSWTPEVEGLEVLRLPSASVFPAVSFNSFGQIARVAVYDEQDASFHTYTAGTASPANPLGTSAAYHRVQVGYRGDTVVPFGATLDPKGGIASAVVYDEQDAAFLTYLAGTASPDNPHGTPATYHRLPIGTRGDTIVPFDVTLDSGGGILRAVVYDEQDASFRTFKEGTAGPSNPGGSRSSYGRLQIGYPGDTIVPVRAAVNLAGQVTQAVVYDEQDASFHSYTAGTRSPNTLGGVPPSYARVPLGRRGDTVVPFGVTIDSNGAIALAAAFDIQDGAALTYRAGTSGPTFLGGSKPERTRVPLGYRGDAIVPYGVTLDSVGHVARAVVYDEQDAAFHAYTEGTAGFNVLGGTPPTYARLQVGYRGDTVVPIFASLDRTGVVAQAVVYDEQDVTVQSYVKGSKTIYNRLLLGYRNDTALPLNGGTSLYGLSGMKSAPPLGSG
ncbi:MAG: hypothetical protein LC745_02105 [Planctomycetia bacterium]|nr:hypothetical protein [Planctomycetia bacterium]